MLRSIARNSLSVLRAEQDRGVGFQRLVFAVLGLLLLVTALLKAQGPADGALGQNAILFSPRLRFLVMEMEAILGLLLLSGWAKRAAWFFAVAFFLMVAGVSLYLGLMGQSSCGCFGRIHVSPWGAFTLDVACVAALGLCRSSFHRGQEEYSCFTPAAGRVNDCWWGQRDLGCLRGGVLLAGGKRPGDLLVRLRGERITVEPLVTDIRSGVAGQERHFTVRLHNHTDRAITIIGGTALCSCMAIDDLPITIPPGGIVIVTVVARFKGTAGLFQQEFRFSTDDKDQDQVLAYFRGQITGPSNR